MCSVDLICTAAPDGCNQHLVALPRHKSVVRGLYINSRLAPKSNFHSCVEILFGMFGGVPIFVCYLD